MQRCNGKTKAGAPCRAPASSGGLCFFSRQSRQSAHPWADRRQEKSLSTTGAACSWFPECRGPTRHPCGGDPGVRSKKITPRTAGALAQLCNSLHRVLQTADREARLARLEQQLTEQEGRKSLDTDATWSRGQEEGGRGMEAPPGDVHTPGIGDGAEDRNHGSGEDGKA